MKVLRLVAIFGIILIGIYFIANITGIYMIYRTHSTANEPALPLGSVLNVSNLPGYNTGDFIVYKTDTVLRVHRLIAVENDILEIKNGVVFVNHKNFDRGRKFIHTYILDQTQYENIKNKITLDLGRNYYPSGKNYIIMVEDKIASDNNLSSYKLISKNNEADPFVNKIFGNNANKDNLGPIRIPNGKFFVLGDNRDNSEDSRYFGLINETDVKGVILR